MFRAENCEVYEFDVEVETLDLWEYQPKLCERCLMVFPNQYYFLTHNRGHLKINLSRNEVLSYFGQNQPKNTCPPIKERNQLEIQREILITSAKENIQKPNSSFIPGKSLSEEDVVSSNPLCNIKKYVPKKKIKTYSRNTPNSLIELKPKNTKAKPPISVNKKNQDNLIWVINKKRNNPIIQSKDNLTLAKNKKQINARNVNISEQIMYRSINEDKERTEEYQCKSCCQVFKLKQCCLLHVKRDTCKSGRFTCQICDKIFRSEASVRTHISRVHMGKNHHCLICNIFFKHPGRLVIHNQYKHTNKALVMKKVKRNLHIEKIKEELDVDQIKTEIKKTEIEIELMKPDIKIKEEEIEIEEHLV